MINKLTTHVWVRYTCNGGSTVPQVIGDAVLSFNHHPGIDEIRDRVLIDINNKYPESYTICIIDNFEFLSEQAYIELTKHECINNS